MSEKPVFIYAATYDNKANAEADYETLRELHSDKIVGTYDEAMINKDEQGKVHVHKHEKPTQHGAWGGAAVGALVGVVFPPSVIASAAIGAGIGGLGGHIREGMSRSDAKELGETLEDGEAALVVIGESRLEEQLEKVFTHATKTIEKELDADSKEFKHELDELAKEGVTV
jgi:uncharacterized membrane protein